MLVRMRRRTGPPRRWARNRASAGLAVGEAEPVHVDALLLHAVRAAEVDRQRPVDERPRLGVGRDLEELVPARPGQEPRDQDRAERLRPGLARHAADQHAVDGGEGTARPAARVRTAIVEEQRAIELPVQRDPRRRCARHRARRIVPERRRTRVRRLGGGRELRPHVPLAPAGAMRTAQVAAGRPEDGTAQELAADVVELVERIGLGGGGIRCGADR